MEIMKPANVIEAIGYFLFDIMGLLIPGSLFLFFTNSILDRPVGNLLGKMKTVIPKTDVDWIIFALMAYIIGYILQGIGEDFFRKAFESRWLRWIPKVKPEEELEAV